MLRSRFSCHAGEGNPPLDLPAGECCPWVPTRPPPRNWGTTTSCRRSPRAAWGRSTRPRTVFTGEIVAVKVIAATTAKNPILLKRFKQEFRAAEQLDHPNVVQAIEYCGTGPQPFLVMEFVDGESLGQRMERIGAFDEADAVRLIAQVCEGLQRATSRGSSTAT